MQISEKAQARFWSKVDRDGPVPVYAPHLGPCWLWTAGGNGEGDYGRFYLDGQMVVAHRLAYTMLVGDIPEGLYCDHLCRVHRCVRPSHLEPVTHRTNILRGAGVIPQHARATHCPTGHSYDAVNTGRDPNGNRFCRECKRRSNRERMRRIRAARKCTPSA